MTALRLVGILAFRSVVAHRVKSQVVGALLFFGTFEVVLGNALLDSIEAGMEGLVTKSLAGHFQLKEADTRDTLSLYGGFGLGSVDMGDRSVESHRESQPTPDFRRRSGLSGVAVPVGAPGEPSPA